MGSSNDIQHPIVDLRSFTKDGNSEDRSKAAQDLVKACAEHGFVTITGHGVSEELLKEAFAWSKELFDLPLEKKMEAPHPAGSIPHRGYSHPGLEKVLSKDENTRAANSNGASLRKIMDFKESYEIGSEDGPQGNIWLPPEILPGFRTFMTRFYWECNKAACTFLDALALGLDLSKSEIEYVKELHSGHNNQLRLLHYPPIPAEMLDTQVLTRMPAHEDWSTFTMLFQDTCGGLELKSATTGTFVPATPFPGACIVNIGDMFERLSNGTFHSPLHRVTLPPLQPGNSDSTRARYSIPYFVVPDDEGVIRCLESKVGEGERYVPVTFEEYSRDRGRYHYQGGREAGTV